MGGKSGPRVLLTGIGGSGPVVLWTRHVTSVFVQQGCTVVLAAGLHPPHAVTETVDEVLDAIDAADAGVPKELGDG